MFTILIILGALPWLLILLHLIFRHGFVVLLVWLLIAPLVTNLIQRTDQQLIYQTSGTEKSNYDADFYRENPANITVQKLLNPTRTVVGLLFAILLLNTFLLKKTRWIPLDKTEIWMGIFSLLLLANVLLRSGRLAFGLHAASDAFILPFLVYYLTRRLVTSEYRFHQLTRIIGYMGFYVIVYCLFERFTISNPFYRLQGLFEVRDTLYVVMEVVFFTTLLDLVCKGHLPAEKPALPRSIQWFVIFMAPVIILLTITRGNWIAFLTGLFALLLLGRRLTSFSGKVRIIGFGLILVPTALVILQVFVPGEFFQGRVSNPDNVLGRFATWQATLQLALEAPVLGVGLNNLNGLLANMKVNFGNFTNYETPHNSFLSMFVELGVVGLFAYLAIVASIMQSGLSLYRKGRSVPDRWRGITVVAIMFAYQVPSLFANTFYIPGLIHVYMYAFVGGVAALYSCRGSATTIYRSASAVQKVSSNQLPHASFRSNSIARG